VPVARVTRLRLVAAFLPFFRALVRLKRHGVASLAASLVVLAIGRPVALGAQQTTPPPATVPPATAAARDSAAAAATLSPLRAPLRPFGALAPRSLRWLSDTLSTLSVSPALRPFGGLAARESGEAIAAAQRSAMEAGFQARFSSLWGQSIAAGPPVDLPARAPAVGIGPAGTPPPISNGAVGATPVTRDTTQNFATGLFSQYADLGIQLNARLETKVESNRNDRCSATELLNIGSTCKGSFQPQFDFQFNLRSGGVVADRVHMNVDYDSQREFDASNNISVYYEGKQDELLQRLEVGNVSFQPPPSRFITGGIPSGNYGLQAVGQLGPMRFRTIMAQQKGNVVKDRVFSVGDRTERAVDNPIEDYQFQGRQFFFTVDPGLLTQPANSDNLDILNRQQMDAAAASLSPSVRPVGVNIYRWRRGSPPVNPNGPRFRVRGAQNTLRNTNSYEYLRPGVDYYIDPSNLWIALVRPLDESEQLVVAYRAADGVSGPDTPGGTPDIEYDPGVEQTANLLWEKELTPTQPEFFRREIRSVYRVGGDDVQPLTVAVKVAIGASGDQERPVSDAAQTYLQLFRLAQVSNASTFDVENRLWPRAGDVNVSQAGVSGGRLIRDHFLVFPSLRPFSRAALQRAAGIAATADPANDSLYSALSADFRSQRRPTSVYHLRMRFNALGGAESGSLSLGSVQVRRNSERLAINGVTLKRDIDYSVEYETGQVTFLHPDTLFRSPQQVQAQYEENPIFAGAAPTNLFGFASTFPTSNGQLNFTAISQSQKTAFTRPPLGSEPASSLVAGVSGEFQFDADRLSLALKRLPFRNRVGESQIAVSGEFATSRPQPNAAGQAYVESFEGEGGTDVPLNSTLWALSSRPFASIGSTASTPASAAAAALLTPQLLTADRAAAMAWQSVGQLNLPSGSFTPVFTADAIDTTIKTAGGTYTAGEQVLWMTMYPLRVGGLTNNGGTTPEARKPSWVTNLGPAQHWRSIRTVLSPSGIDLTRAETFEFWALIDTTGARRQRNPTLVFDFGDVSENVLAFAPETLCVQCNDVRTPVGSDSLYVGRRIAGLDTLDSERDPQTRSFDQARDDVGLPGDRVKRLTVVQNNLRGRVLEPRLDVPICSGGDQIIRALGDTRSNCTVQNNRLDEEDIDLDGQLNFPQPEGETAMRYVVNLADTLAIDRYGVCFDTTRAPGGSADRCTGTTGPVWTHFRVSFRAPTDSSGRPNLRLIRALRMTMVSAAGAEDTVTRVAVARMRLVGAPWVKRSDRPIEGIAGSYQAGSTTSTVIASLIATGESSRGTRYQSPPGVTDESANKNDAVTAGGAIQVNEKSMRVQAVGLAKGQRAEAYYRFDGVRNFMGYKELRVWARGVGDGWGTTGGLQFFVKAGRDESNFYLYRRPVGSGQGQAAWTDATVDLERFYDLRAELQNVYLRGGTRDASCTDPVDVDLITRSKPDGVTPLSLGTNGNVYAACYAAPDGGHYLALTANPNVSAPNLSAVQDMSVGIVRVDSGSTTLDRTAGLDTLELWVDDIRLTKVVNTPGYAGQVGLTINAGDIANVRMNVSRRDPNFRQLGEQPSFITDNAFDVSASLALEKLLPQALGVSMPLTVTHSRSASDPFFLAQSDVRGAGIAGLRTPEASSTNYQLSLQKITPSENRWIGPVVNNLALNGSLTTGNARTEFSDGSSKAYALNAAYALSAQARTARIPGFLDRAILHLPTWLSDRGPMRALRTSEFRLNPTTVRLTSALARSEDQNQAFTKPVSGTTDTARFSRSLQSVWQNAAAVELRPVPSLALRWDATSRRDLRHYGDSSARRSTQDGGTIDLAPVLAGERQRLLGLDVGLETSRNMTASVSWAPAISAWLQPRVDLGSTYSMTRNPNAPSLVRDSSSGRDRLPRELQNSQVFTLGSVVDLGRAIAARGTAGRLRRGVSSVLQPFDVNYSRTVSSVFANAPITPGFGYQFATGGIGNFLSLGSIAATNAVLSNQLSANQSLNLPLGLNAVTRFQRSASRNYTRRVDQSLGVNDVSQLSWPNVSLRWSFRPPSLLRGVIASVGANAGLEATRQLSVSSGATVSSPVERSDDASRSYPLNGSVTWARFGLSTSGSYSLVNRVVSRPGARATQRSNEMSVDVGKAFVLPASWKAQDKLNTHVAYQASRSQSLDFSAAAQASGADVEAVRRVTAAINRNSINFNADTRLSSSMIGTLNFTRVVNANLYSGTRYTQILVSAVLQLQFFAGELH
jgi:Motility related/secretion protein